MSECRLIVVTFLFQHELFLPHLQKGLEPLHSSPYLAISYHAPSCTRQGAQFGRARAVLLEQLCSSPPRLLHCCSQL